jgi:hypothetical protein
VHARVDFANDGYALLATGTEASVAVIFVHGFGIHGFGGHPEKTWLQFQTLMDSVEGSRMFPWWTTYDAYFYSYDSKRQIGPNTADLLNFIDGVFPVPRWKKIGASGIEELVRRYGSLVLVGHSEGGVLIRSAILRHIQANGEEHNRRLPHDILDAHLRLFAPALWGALISGWKGVLLRSSILRDLVQPYLCQSPAYQQLAQNSPLLDEIRRRTVDLAKKNPDIRGLRAKNVFGVDDEFVCMEALETDPPALYEPNCTHESVCKPSNRYLTPLAFVRHDDETTIAIAS